MSTKLNRSISLTGLVFYGVGTMIGGGIYALLGKVAGAAGLFTPWSMLLAGVMAVFSALTFAELSSRMPYAGGPAKYIAEGFGSTKLGSVFGWLVVATGIVSAATLTVAMSGFFLDLFELPVVIGKLIVVLTLLFPACWGIKQSVVAVALVTLIEVIGLLLVIAVNIDAFSNMDWNITNFIPSADGIIWSGIIAGSFIAFYAFIGFEDMVALAEEVKASKKNLPIAIIISVVITLILYIAIAVTAIVGGELSEFVSSNTPMAHLVKSSSWLSPQVLVFISLLAGFNGALVQVIMASRIMYGMANENQAPKFFKAINNKTRTPIRASLVVALILLTLAIFVELITLAKLTSGIILFVFAGMNFCLLKIKLEKKALDSSCIHAGFEVHIVIPIIGLILSVASLLFAIVTTSGSVH